MLSLIFLFGFLSVFPVTKCQNIVASPVVITTYISTPAITPAPTNTLSLIDGRPWCQQPYLYSTFSTIMMMQGCSPERMECCPQPTTRANRQYFKSCPADYTVVAQYNNGVVQCCPKGYDLVGLSIANPSTVTSYCQTAVTTAPPTMTTPPYFWFPDAMSADTSYMYALEIYADTKSGNSMTLPTGDPSANAASRRSALETSAADTGTVYRLPALAGAVVGSLLAGAAIAGCICFLFFRSRQNRHDEMIPPNIMESQYVSDADFATDARGNQFAPPPPPKPVMAKSGYNGYPTSAHNAHWNYRDPSSRNNNYPDAVEMDDEMSSIYSSAKARELM